MISYRKQEFRDILDCIKSKMSNISDHKIIQSDIDEMYESLSSNKDCVGLLDGVKVVGKGILISRYCDVVPELHKILKLYKKIMHREEIFIKLVSSRFCSSILSKDPKDAGHIIMSFEAFSRIEDEAVEECFALTHNVIEYYDLVEGYSKYVSLHDICGLEVSGLPIQEYCSYDQAIKEFNILVGEHVEL
jgi:hypothetical protein